MALVADHGFEMQEKVVDLILERLNSAAVADLPAMLQHLLQNVNQGNAKQVTTAALRLHSYVMPRS